MSSTIHHICPSGQLSKIVSVQIDHIVLKLDNCIVDVSQKRFAFYPSIAIRFRNHGIKVGESLFIGHAGNLPHAGGFVTQAQAAATIR